MQQIVYLKAGKYKIKTTLTYEGARIYVQFPYNKALLAEIRAMKGKKWHGYDDPNPRKVWSIAWDSRNLFQLALLQGEDPYAPYDLELSDLDTTREVYDHQREMFNQALTFRHTIFACEMGTGKTLAAIEVMEWAAKEWGLDHKDAWYVGPRSGVKAVGRELLKWKSKVIPKMFTYEALTKEIRDWEPGAPAPRVVVFDESSKIKTHTSQRSKAAYYLAECMREEWGRDCIILEMSGTPAPKTPVDWWHQCEVVCPGFLREGEPGAFKQRLCLVEMRESPQGGAYPHIISWLDDELKCGICGEFEKGHMARDTSLDEDISNHSYKKSKNEVEYLYKRMQGLVMVKFKKDCLQLPDKRYEVIKVKSTPSILRTAKVIARTTGRAVQTLTLLRELSDGFQYFDEPDGYNTCGTCGGTCKIIAPVPVGDFDPMAPNTGAQEFEEEERDCDYCGGEGKIQKYKRGTKLIECPKDDATVEILDAHNEHGRIIIWGGFTGTIDKLIKLCHRHGWATLRVDGRGYDARTATGEVLDSDEILEAMDESAPRRRFLDEKYPKVAFVGHPKAGGMALTLTASPTELFYSNVFDGEARMQAEDRFHRAGMNVNRGATIIDLVHLPTDQLILDNLQKKKDLQSLSMGDLKAAFEGEV